MTTAIDIIHKALTEIGAHSVLQPADPSLIVNALDTLKALLSDLEKESIILQETVNGTTTKISIPTDLTDELNEPAASTYHLKVVLSEMLANSARVTLTPQNMRVIDSSKSALLGTYFVPNYTNIVPSTLLPKGQGGSQRFKRQTFFDGEALDNDTDSST